MNNINCTLNDSLGAPCFTMEATFAHWVEHYEEAFNHTGGMQSTLLDDTATLATFKPSMITYEPTDLRMAKHLALMVFQQNC